MISVLSMNRPFRDVEPVQRAIWYEHCIIRVHINFILPNCFISATNNVLAPSPEVEASEVSLIEGKGMSGNDIRAISNFY